MKIFFSKKNKIATLFFLGSLIFYAPTVQAAGENSGPTISIVPHTFDLNVFPGEIVEDKIKVYNQGSIAIPFKLKLISFDAAEETGDMQIGDLNDKNSSFREWIKFDQEEFIIDPQEKKVINFSLKIPADAPNQGYYFMVLLQADISTYYFNENRIQTIPNLGVPFLLRVGEEEEGADKLAILEYSIPAEKHLAGTEKIVNFFGAPFLDEDEKISVVKSGEPVFLVKLKNNGFYHTKLEGEIDLAGLGWKIKDNLNVPSVTILPGKTRQILVQGASAEKMLEQVIKKDETGELAQQKLAEKTLGFGIMRASLNLEAKDGFEKKASQWVFVFSWQMIGWLFLLIIFILIIIKLIRKIMQNKKRLWRLKKLFVKSFTRRIYASKKIIGKKLRKTGRKIANRKKISLWIKSCKKQLTHFRNKL